MKLPQASWRTRPGMARLLAALGGDQGETRFVGGCVRDALLGLDVNDIDLATRLAPDEVIRRLEAARIKAVPTGLAHGTITAVAEGQPVEVTTLRRDVATDGRRATIAYTGDWREDAARRDFTINALSADPVSGEIFDYFDGVADLEARRVRFIGDALTRIAEDHLRILRFFRFHARFGAGQPDEAALEACVERANDLMALSRERIADELWKLLALPDPAPTVALMVELGILRPVLPEIDGDGVQRLRKLIARERALSIPPAPARRLSALLPGDPEQADRIGARLRLSNATRRQLETYADRIDGGWTARQILGGSSLFEREVVDMVLLSKLDDPEVFEQLRSLDGWQRPQFPLRGRDLLTMGLSEGPQVAAILTEVRKAWVDADFPDETWVLDCARKKVDQLLRSSQ